MLDKQELKVLRFLREENKNVGVGRLEMKLGMKREDVRHVLTTLELKGFVTVERNPGGDKIKRATITESGIESFLEKAKGNVNVKSELDEIRQAIEELQKIVSELENAKSPEEKKSLLERMNTASDVYKLN